MKKRFLKILIAFTLTFGIFFSFNIFTNPNHKQINNNRNDIVFAETKAVSKTSTTYCFSISNEIKIVTGNLNQYQYHTLRNVPIDEIVVHHSAGENTSVEDIDKIHMANGWGGIGYHFYIRTDGTIYKGRDIEYVGAHCIGKNFNSIGICLEGNFDNHEPSSQQMGSLVNLSLKLSEEYNINKFSPHRDSYATNCPGEYFPWDFFIHILSSVSKEV